MLKTETIRRRQFLKLAASAAAIGGTGGTTLLAQEARPERRQPQQDQEPPIPLGNGEPPGTARRTSQLGSYLGRCRLIFARYFLSPAAFRAEDLRDRR